MLTGTHAGGQEPVIRLMHALGYRSNDHGVCAGVAMMFVLAFLNGKLDTFNAAMELIQSESDLAAVIREFQSRRARESREHHASGLSDREKNLLAVLVLLDGIELFQQPEFYREWFGQANSQLDVDRIAQLFLSTDDQLKDQCSLHKVSDWFGMYSRGDLLFLLRALLELGKESQIDLAFTFDNTIHKISFCYDCRNKSWLLCDANEKNIKIFKDAAATDLVDVMFDALMENRKSRKGEYVCFVTSAYALEDNRPALEEAVARLKKSAVFEIAQELMPRKISATTLNGVTLAHLAAYTGHTPYLNLLVQRGFDFNVQNLAGLTPVHLAAFRGADSLIRTMARAGADCNRLTRDGIAPVHIAAQYDRCTCVAALAEARADLNVMTSEGDAAIHIAAEFGHADVCRMLADQHADINLPNKYGYTAANIAAMFKHTAVFDVLSQRGAKARFFQPAKPYRSPGSISTARLLNN